MFVAQGIRSTGVGGRHQGPPDMTGLPVKLEKRFWASRWPPGAVMLPEPAGLPMFQPHLKIPGPRSAPSQWSSLSLGEGRPLVCGGLDVESLRQPDLVGGEI